MNLPLHTLISNRGFDRYEESFRSKCQVLGLRYQLIYCEPTDNPAMRLEFDSETHLGRLTCWESGLCDLEVLCVADGNQILMQHLEFESEQEFADIIPSLLIRMTKLLKQE